MSSDAGTVAAAHQEYAYRKMGFKDSDRIAAFDGASVPADLRAKHIFWVPVETKEELPYGSIRYSSLYMNDDTLPHYLDHIIKSKYSFFYGYPSAIDELATYCLNNSIILPQPLKGVQLTAEVAYDSQIQRIRDAFRTNVFRQYGHSEVSIYGHTWTEDGIYECSPLMGYTEVVDDNGDLVSVGEVGEVVVTGLWNYAMPFIRYRTGDIARYEGSVNGVVTLGALLGRTQDYVYGQDGRVTSLTALVFGQHLKGFACISKWQLVQDRAGHVVVRVIQGPNYDEEVENEIRCKFAEIADVTVSFAYVDEIPKSPRGKSQFLIQSVIPSGTKAVH